MFSVIHLSIITSSTPQNSSRQSYNYQEYENELNLSEVKYTVDIKNIEKFQHQNNISLNFYKYEDEKSFLLSITTMSI